MLFSNQERRVSKWKGGEKICRIGSGYLLRGFPLAVAFGQSIKIGVIGPMKFVQA